VVSDMAAQSDTTGGVMWPRWILFTIGGGSCLHLTIIKWGRGTDEATQIDARFHSEELACSICFE